MPNELKIPAKPAADDKSVHQILQESRVSKDDEANVQTQEQEGPSPAEVAAQNELVNIVNQEADSMEQKVAETLNNLPVELNNAQIAAQIQNLTPEEAQQMAQEAQIINTGSRPPNAINLMIAEANVSGNASNATQSSQSMTQLENNGEMDAAEISSLESLSREAQSIEKGFTDYIVSDSEKNMVASIFDEKIEHVQ